MAENGADLKGFLEAAGRSLADAQGALAGDVADIPAAVAISEAELEVKATMEGAQGSVVLQPVTQAAQPGKCRSRIGARCRQASKTAGSSS